MEQEIIEKYKSGISISKLLQEYPNYNRRQINQILLQNNISIRGGRHKKNLTSEQINILKQQIDNGFFLKDIAKNFNIDPETLRNQMKELNLEPKTKNRVNRHIKSNFFSVIDSPIKAYWVGFLFTDGSVDCKHKTGRIRLQLQEQDLEILEKFKKDLGIESKIIYDKRKNSTCCSVEFVDSQIFNDLKKFNIIPNKTYTVNHLPIDVIPSKYLSSFALGLFDGDGNFSCSKNFSTDVAFGYTAYSKNEVEEFQKLINTLANINNNNKVYFTSAWHTNWRGRLQVLKILDVLYKDNPRFLKRKHDLYLKLKNSLD